ncbi:uncharacterized protein (TIGR03083 family) [Thermocatellispora tengchongensis]|uniref:Uncharacterized protein (TIGR03083 family) n=1 Tax=Thermocatellispora tengchongensis TaxID=1073253 RepID=A0A840PCZ1_9ACTN|nr:maleylpyruvate isomerase family mycothiol-dependent enzyme [Thermocatellispora tengchongensis]MBB5137102.1 uncharacterized protein (TIGR03083 family) [Thermocatellispora tengchongensis]
MTLLGHERYCREIAEQTGMIRRLLADADLSTPVPTCPGWSLATLVRHVAGNLHTLDAAVRNGSADAPDTPVPADTGRDAEKPGVLDAWLADGATRCAASLRKAGADVEVSVWGLEQLSGAWARRAAHDAAVHRADAAFALGQGYTLAQDLAADAVDELLELFQDLRDSVPRLAGLRGRNRSIHLHATDTPPELTAEWLIELEPEGFAWRRAHAKAGVALRAPLADLLLILYRRLPPTTARAQIIGEKEILDFWLDNAVLE